MCRAFPHAHCHHLSFCLAQASSQTHQRTHAQAEDSWLHSRVVIVNVEPWRGGTTNQCWQLTDKPNRNSGAKTKIKNKKNKGKKENNNGRKLKRDINENWFVLQFFSPQGNEWLGNLGSSCKKWKWNETEAEVPTSGSSTMGWGPTLG